MTPINLDLIISAVCAGFGLYMLVWKLHACNPKKYTPALCSIAVLTSLLAWCTLLLISYSALKGYPEWIYSNWKGSWGHTNVRIGFAIFYFLTLIHMCKYAPKSKKERSFKI